MGVEGERLLEGLRRRASRPDLDGRVSFAGDARRSARRPEPSLVPAALRRPRGLRKRPGAGDGLRPPGSGSGERRPARDRGRGMSAGSTRPATPRRRAGALVEVLDDPDRARELGAAARVRARRFDARTRPAGLRERGAARPCARRLTAPPSRPAAEWRWSRSPTTPGRRCSPCCARCAPTCRARAWSWWTRAPGTAARRPHASRRWRTRCSSWARTPGFGRASNAGVALVDEPVCVLVNPDVELIDDSLASLAAALEPAARTRAHPRAGGPLPRRVAPGHRPARPGLAPVAAARARAAGRPPCPLRARGWTRGCRSRHGRWAGRWAAAWWPAPRRCAASGPSTSASSSSGRTSSSGCAPRGGRRDLVLPAGPGAAPRRALHRPRLRRRAPRPARAHAPGGDR